MNADKTPTSRERPSMIKHPPAYKLDALAAGDAAPEVEAHLDACEACRAYVTSAAEAAGEFRATADPAAFAEAVGRAAVARGEGEKAGRERAPAKVVRWAAWATPVLAAAAALTLWARGAPTLVGVVVAPSATAPSSATRFKGARAVAVIRERGGRQERLLGPLTVRAGDRLRVEVDIDHDEPITAGLIGDDGSWFLLLAPTLLGAGRHYSEQAARFDESPTSATLLVGSPDAVERARHDPLFDPSAAGIVAWHVTSDPL